MLEAVLAIKVVMAARSAWPDIAVGLLIAGMFSISAITVLGGARRAL